MQYEASSALTPELLVDRFFFFTFKYLILSNFVSRLTDFFFFFFFRKIDLFLRLFSTVQKSQE